MMRIAISSCGTELIRHSSCLSALVGLSLFLSGCRQDAPQSASSSETAPAASTAETISAADIEEQIHKFCGGCHAVPRPESFPKVAWYDEVRRGYDFYFKSGRKDLTPPVQSQVVNWFRDRAPERLSLSPPDHSPSPVAFTTHEWRLRGLPGASNADSIPAVASITWSPDPSRQSGMLRLCDMRQGLVISASGPAAGGLQTWFDSAQRLAVCPHPAVVRVCDLNANGLPDLLVCDLGSFLPEDHDRGQLIWLPDHSAGAETSPVILLQKAGRIADCRVADFDGDGDMDVVVAEFGWHSTGGIHLLWNDGVSTDLRTLNIRRQQLDERPGTIHVPVADLNGDGRMDFVALISQEHEMIVAFLNRPDGFEKRVLYAAPDPSWGSSGIELVDLDQDGDLDVVYTNGDSFDSYLLKPYHGVRWLENRGDGILTERLLASVPGVHRAVPADLDGDGDLDLAICALIPDEIRQIEGESGSGVLWLEQTAPGVFERHQLAESQPRHAALEVGDFDSDGDLDIVVGNFSSRHDATQSAVILFRNEGR